MIDLEVIKMKSFIHNISSFVWSVILIILIFFALVLILLEVTYDDYRLSGSVVTNKLIKISRSIKYIADTNKWKVTLKCSYNNSSTTSNVTIKEWGLWRGNSNCDSITFGHDSKSILVYREVLDEPIVIEPNTTATLTFTLEIPMPNHP